MVRAHGEGGLWVTEHVDKFDNIVAVKGAEDGDFSKDAFSVDWTLEWVQVVDLLKGNLRLLAVWKRKCGGTFL